MIRLRNFFFLLTVLASPVAAQRQSLGVFGTWASFQNAERCHAVSAPYRGPQPQEWRPFLAVAHWPGRPGGGQLHARLSRDKRQGSAVLIRIDGRSFQLVGSGRDAWAPDPRADRDIQTAMRTGIELVVETRSTRGGLVRDHYRLRGAATAMDAAALGCRPNR